MVFFGRNPLIEDVWLAASFSKSPINYWVLSEFAQTGYWTRSLKSYNVSGIEEKPILGIMTVDGGLKRTLFFV